MNLEELQERYPHGSRWRRASGTSPFTVIGWEPGREYEVTIRWDDTGRLDRHQAGFENEFGSGPWKRITDLPPCPITKTVTAYLRQIGGSHPATGKVVSIPGSDARVGQPSLSAPHTDFKVELHRPGATWYEKPTPPEGVTWGVWVMPS